MATTIQLSHETVDILKLLRRTTQTNSYDEAIQVLVKKATLPAQSMYGYLGKKSMKHILEGLRDEEDRV